MPLPDKFDYTRQLRSITKKLHNEKVTEFFKNIRKSDGNLIEVPEDSVSTSLADFTENAPTPTTAAPKAAAAAVPDVKALTIPPS
jgi:hypothetical protein